LDLLAQAALAPEDQAIAAWRAWRASHDIDTTPWPAVRMLGAVAARISRLEPDAPIRPRLAGIRKFLWTQSQIGLQHAAGGLAALHRANIPVLLMKGAARIAADPASAQERLIRDVDVLVPLDRQRPAFEALRGEGWSLGPENWQRQWHRWAPVAAHHAWSLNKGRSEIDLHHFSNHLNRLRGDDEGLWARSRALEWRGVPVRVPAPADALLLALVHGARWSQEGSADWVVDASALLDAGAVNWDVFLAETRARLLQAVVLPGLTFLRSVLRKPVPRDVLDALQSGITREQQAEREQYAGTVLPFTGRQVSNALFMAVRRVRASAQRSLRETPGARRTRLLKTCSLELKALHRMCALRLPSPLDQAGRILVRVKVSGTNGWGEEPFVCTVLAPGLTLGVLTGRRSCAGRTDSPQVAVLAVPESLLELRGIQVLRFSFERKNLQGGFSVTLSILRHA
jgi:hypothetical protein